MTNETVHFAQAEPWSQDHLSLIFDKRLPSFIMRSDSSQTPLHQWEGRAHSYYRAEGEQLAHALLAHLPGGLIDGLLLALFAHKASLFSVPFLDPAEGPQDMAQGPGR